MSTVYLILIHTHKITKVGIFSIPSKVCIPDPFPGSVVFIYVEKHILKSTFSSMMMLKWELYPLFCCPPVWPVCCCWVTDMNESKSHHSLLKSPFCLQEVNIWKWSERWVYYHFTMSQQKTSRSFQDLINLNLHLLKCSNSLNSFSVVAVVVSEHRWLQDACVQPVCLFFHKQVMMFFCTQRTFESFD